jgi:hypothetical protein
MEQSFANDEAENGVAEEFHPLVRLEAMQRAGSVRERAEKERFVGEGVAETRFTLRDLIEGRFLCPGGSRALSHENRNSQGDQ